jgi:hypothetical protein
MVLEIAADGPGVEGISIRLAGDSSNAKVCLPKNTVLQIILSRFLNVIGDPEMDSNFSDVGVSPLRNITLLDQLQQLEKLGRGHEPWKALRVRAEENRAEVNFELVSGPPSAKRETGPTLAGFATSGRRSFEIREMC